MKEGFPVEHDVRTHESVPRLVVCSLCLRVHYDAHWVEAELVIRQLRTFDRPLLMRLEPGMCDACTDSIVQRRSRSTLEDTLAA
jgi:hypothetical protein